ncbi:family 16 glycoside hydrolase [Planctomycetaceae bacterium SH139]
MRRHLLSSLRPTRRCQSSPAGLAFLLLVAFSLQLTTIGRAQVFATPEAAAEDPDFQVQGEYAGNGKAIQVVAIGDGEFQLVIYEGGLPGAGWTGAAPQRLDGDADLVTELADSMGLTKMERKSPTLGAQPPPGAVVLFDGSEASMENWEAGARRTADGLLMQGATSRQQFGDYTIHLEFRTPYQPTAAGQQRGNSGLYHQARYETQILDSFGLEGLDNEAGGIYSIRRPDLNACLPPLSWQTYDVEFTAARYDGAGKKTANATVTVRLNGILIHSNVVLPKTTTAAPRAEGPTPGPIYLQDHGNPVRFRNIWVMPRDAEQDSKRPLIPGYERFYAATALGADLNDRSLIDGGQVLAEGLGCLNCHEGRERVWEPAVGPVLNGIGGRVRADFLVRWIHDPHAAKPGTTMPSVLDTVAADERERISQAIASYLILSDTSETMLDRSGDASGAERGEKLYHSIGCVACHAPQNDWQTPNATNVPLGPLSEKYTLDSLAAFLQNPHATRPDGRMPRLVADPMEARDVATYLLRDVVLVPGAQQFSRTVYRGNWDSLPDFDKLQPVAEAEVVAGLSFAGISPLNQFGAVYEAYLPIIKAGKYTLTIGSDDGSRVLVDAREVVRVDGVHPYQQVSGDIELTTGVHRLRVEYFEGGGEERLTLEIAGPDLPRMAISTLVTQDPEGDLQRQLVPQTFVADPALKLEGERLFSSLGCANCHVFEPAGQAIEASLTAKPWRQLQPQQGCLAEQVPASLPQYALTTAQRNSLQAAITARPPQRERENLIQLTLTAANCYACHMRDGIGGPELARNQIFQTTTPEMGDEGRVPPPLTGVGDKLKDEYFAKVLDAGANQRPYMLTRMPAFGYERMKLLHQRLNKQDRQSSELPDVASQPTHRWLADGRELVGNEGLACIKCHTYGGEGTPGIQAIDMLEMPKRLRRDWFHRYMLNPQTYRPGTRMPASFPEGKSVLTKIADGDPAYQIEAMWQFLLEGDPRKIPSGLRPGAIELVPSERPIIYRNFLTDMSARGIAVGYPEQVHIAWDADRLALAKIWQNQFLDASLHWRGRGPGRLGPLGDAVLTIEQSAPVAILASVTAPWPNAEQQAADSSAAGQRFLGYALDAAGRPSFRYQTGSAEILETYLPTADTETGAKSLTRRLDVKRSLDSKSTGLVIVRLASGQIERLTPTSYRVNDQFTLELSTPDVQLVEGSGKQELRTSLGNSDEASVEFTYRW